MVETLSNIEKGEVNVPNGNNNDHLTPDEEALLQTFRRRRVLDRMQTPQIRPAPYLLAVVVITLATIGLAITILALRPNSDPTVIVANILGAYAPTVAAILAYLKSQETQKAVNGQLDQWKQDFASVVRAETLAKVSSGEINVTPRQGPQDAQGERRGGTP